MTQIQDNGKVTSVQQNPEEEVLFTSLRAKDWGEFHGQPHVKRALQIALSAAKKREEPIEHVLFYGPPGLGKTTLSHLIAKEMESNIRVTSGPALARAGDLASILTNLQPGDVLFIDEIHRLHKAVEETLYSAMEDFVLDVIIGKGPSARTLRLDLPRFTIVGATTRVGLLSAPLRDRFGVVHRLEFYSPEELTAILAKAAEKLAVTIDDESLLEIARRSRGTPRIALRFLKRVRDVAAVKEEEKITPALTQEALDMLRVDPLGLDDADRRFLLAIIEKHHGGPVGLETIASMISEDIDTITDMLEPFLLQLGFLQRTPRGRIVTQAAYRHFEKKYTPLPQQKLL